MTPIDTSTYWTITIEGNRRAGVEPYAALTRVPMERVVSVLEAGGAIFSNAHEAVRWVRMINDSGMITSIKIGTVAEYLNGLKIETTTGDVKVAIQVGESGVAVLLPPEVATAALTAWQTNLPDLMLQLSRWGVIERHGDVLASLCGEEIEDEQD